MTELRDTIPGWEGSIGPGPGQYGDPHVYARDVRSGAGSCVCGQPLRDSLHVQAAPGVPIEITGDTSDGHHTFKQLYEYRLLYNAAAFNEWAAAGKFDVHKSRRHHDGEVPFGDPDWFVVVAQLPTGQISNHYRLKHWSLFRVPERERAAEYDGHTPDDAALNLHLFLLSN